MSSTMETKDTLKKLGKAAAALKGKERDAKDLRALRNTLMAQALEEGYTERQVAEKARVSGAYAHRVKTSGGKPQSGPAMDAEREAATAEG